MAETIQYPSQVIERTRALGNLGAIVIGSANVYVAFDGTTRAPEDIDIALDDDAFREAHHAHPEWELVAVPGTDKCHLVGEGFDIGVGWGDISYATLKEEARRTNGLMFAHLADVYAYKQRRNAKSDQEDLRRIRELIQGPGSHPLPPHLTTHEQALISTVLPESMLQSSEARHALELASSGLSGIRIVYGDMARGQVNRATVDKNGTRYDILATFHEGGLHTLDGLRWLVRHMTAVNAKSQETGQPATFSKADFMEGVITYAYRNAIFGNAKSTALVQAHASKVGHTPDSLLRDPSQNRTPLARALRGADGQYMSEAYGLERIYHYVAESINLSSLEHAARSALGRTALSHDPRLFSPSVLFALVDDFPNAHLAPAELTVKETLLRHMSKALASIDPRIPGHYRYPEPWTGEHTTIRLAHAQELRRHVQAIARNEMSVTEGYEEAARHTSELKTRYPELTLATS